MPTILNRRGRPPHPDILTPAEWQVLEGVRAGRTNQEIADQLGVTFHTVKFHVSNMLAKLQLRDRQQLAEWRPAPVESAPSRNWRALVPWGGLKVAGAGLAVAGLGAGVILAVFVILGDDSEPAVGVLPTSTPRPTATPAPPATTACPPVPAPAPAREAPDIPPPATAGVELRVLMRGHAFTRLNYQVETNDAAPAGSVVRAEGLSVTAYTPAGPVAVGARPGSISVSGGSHASLTLDTDPLPADTTAVVVDVPAFGFTNLRTGCLEGRTSGPFTGVATIDPNEPFPGDLSDRVPSRIDTGFGWSWVIHGIARETPTRMWVTYAAEGQVQGLVPNSPETWQGEGYLPFRGAVSYTTAVLIPKDASSMTLKFGAAHRWTDRSQPQEEAPLESGDWSVTVPLD
jgi:DNA-binding CsgD family transcriptional regulator